MSSLRSTKKLSQRGRRKLRVRKKIQGSAERPRLNVFRSAKHIYVQVIDDAAGATLASASTMQKPLSSESGDKAELAKKGFRVLESSGGETAFTRDGALLGI